MRWKDYMPLIKHKHAYSCVCLNLTGSRPKSLFNNILEEIEDSLQNDKKVFIQSMLNTKLSFDKGSNFEDYKCLVSNLLEDINDKALKNKTSQPVRLMQNFNVMTKSNLKLCFDEISCKFNKQKEIEKKRDRKLRDSYLLVIKNYLRNSNNFSFQKALNDLHQLHGFIKISYNNEKRRY